MKELAQIFKEKKFKLLYFYDKFQSRVKNIKIL